MALTGIYANLACTSLDRSERWYRTLFDRAPDARPMEGLVEWHVSGHGFQLHRDAEKAGHGTLTLMTDGVEAERARLAALDPGPVEAATQVSIVRLADPDGNLVVLAGAA